MDKILDLTMLSDIFPTGYHGAYVLVPYADWNLLKAVTTPGPGGVRPS
jgi:hypothetical protein